MSKQHEKIAQRALATEVHRDGFEGDPELNESLIRDRAKAKRNEIKLIRQRLAASIDGQIRWAADAVVAAGNNAMGDSAYAAFRGRLNRASEAAQVDRLLAELEDGYEARGRNVKVTTEPRVYGPESAHSYFMDVATITAGESEVGVFRTGEAAERLNRYAAEVGYEIRRDSKEGKYAKRQINELTRVGDPQEHRRRSKDAVAIAETRTGIGTGGGTTASAASSASVFVSPYFIIADWAPFRGTCRSFADQCFSWPCPEYGLEIYIPYFSSTTGVSQQTEGSAVTETDPATALQSAQLQTVTGEVTISTQLHERGFLGGGTFDKVLGRQIHQQLDEKIDVYTLNQVVSGGASVSGNSSFSMANLYQDVAKGREQLTDTAGTRLRPTHFFSTADFYSYVTRQVDATTNRPVVTPHWAPGFPISNGGDDGPQSDNARPKWARFTGTVLPGSVLWFTDDNIPASGSNTQLIVSAPDQAVTLCESDPVLTAFVDSANTAGALQVIVNLRSYAAAVLRHASGSATIVGSAYTTSLV